MRMVSALCLVLALADGQALVRRASLRGSSEPARCPCRPANFTALLRNGSLPVSHAMLYPGSDQPDEVFPFPADYGSSCQAWDEASHPACKDKAHPPSWCHAEWCYVDPTCAAEAAKAENDIRPTVHFGKQELYYSYAACGAVDTATPEACLVRDKASCLDTPACAWQAAQELCQSKLCQCQGGELPAGTMNGTMNFAAEYGSTCGAWDHDRCRAFAEDESGKPADESLGLWCCMSFCFVDAKCPSATPHPALKGKYVSYVACPSDPEELKECPAGSEPKDAHGNPLPVSDSVSQALEHQLIKAREAQRTEVPRPLHEMYKDKDGKK
jgi:hypothetical protein